MVIRLELLIFHLKSQPAHLDELFGRIGIGTGNLMMAGSTTILKCPSCRQQLRGELVLPISLGLAGFSDTNALHQ
jgi:hypothetical protein